MAAHLVRLVHWSQVKGLIPIALKSDDPAKVTCSYCLKCIKDFREKELKEKNDAKS